jgi:hypothetical protein
MQLICQVTDDALSPAVHGRTVDHLAAELNKTGENVFKRLSFGGRLTDIKHLPGAKPDCRDFLPAGRNHPLQNRVSYLCSLHPQGNEDRSGGSAEQTCGLPTRNPARPFTHELNSRAPASQCQPMVEFDLNDCTIPVRHLK